MLFLLQIKYLASIFLRIFLQTSNILILPLVTFDLHYSERFNTILHYWTQVECTIQFSHSHRLLPKQSTKFLTFISPWTSTCGYAAPKNLAAPRTYITKEKVLSSFIISPALNDIISQLLHDYMYSINICIYRYWAYNIIMT